MNPNAPPVRALPLPASILSARVVSARLAEAHLLSLGGALRQGPHLAGHPNPVVEPFDLAVNQIEV